LPELRNVITARSYELAARRSGLPVATMIDPPATEPARCSFACASSTRQLAALLRSVSGSMAEKEYSGHVAERLLAALKAAL
jgi:hypothetical protein